MSQIEPVEKDVLLASAIASGASNSAAARKLGISRATVKRRLHDPNFRRIIADLRGEILRNALGRMTAKITGAVDNLDALLNDDNPSIRLRAFRALMTFGLRLHESIELNDRIGELEAELARKTGGDS